MTQWFSMTNSRSHGFPRKEIAVCGSTLPCKSIIPYCSWFPELTCRSFHCFVLCLICYDVFCGVRNGLPEKSRNHLSPFFSLTVTEAETNLYPLKSCHYLIWRLKRNNLKTHSLLSFFFQIFEILVLENRKFKKYINLGIIFISRPLYTYIYKYGNIKYFIYL